MLSFTPVGIGSVILYLFIAVAIGLKKRIPIRQQLLAFLLFGYLLGVIAVTFFPIPIDPNMIKVLRSSSGEIHKNLLPFNTIILMIKNNPWHFHAFLNIAGNVSLFVPFGFLIPILFKNFNRPLKLISLGFITTLAIEISQLIISYMAGFTFRSFDIDDIILNTLGVIVGFIFLRAYQSTRRRVRKPTRTNQP